MTGAQDTHRILSSLSVHLYQPLSISPPPPPSPLFVTLPSSLVLFLSPPLRLPPCLRHLFIEASCQYTAYPLSLPPHRPLQYTKKHKPTHTRARSQRLKRASGRHRLLKTSAMPLQLTSYLLFTITAVSLLILMLPCPRPICPIHLYFRLRPVCIYNTKPAVSSMSFPRCHPQRAWLRFTLQLNSVVTQFAYERASAAFYATVVMWTFQVGGDS